MFKFSEGTNVISAKTVIDDNFNFQAGAIQKDSE